MHQLLIEPLGSEHDRAAFDCGDPAINDYLCNGRIDEYVGRRGCTAKVGVLEEHGSRVLIEPKNERLAEYYARLGFKALPDHGLLMYQPMRTNSRAFMGT